MKILQPDVDRKNLIDFYLRTDNEKKNKTMPADYGSLNWNDPNALDRWLQQHGYKSGILSGYKRWAHVQLSKDDLMDTAIANHIFIGQPQRLGDLVDTESFQKWAPPQKPYRSWYEPLSRGENPKDLEIILRPAVSSEGSKYYVEDGSGRSICYLRSIHNFRLDSEMCAYIGTEPDPQSIFMQQRPELLKHALRPSDLK
jgi:hypothetical protein